MAKGIIYVMNTCVDGLVKIGKTGSDQFENRMSELERNGYSRIAVLTREFAIEVEDYNEKEKLLHEIFSKSRVGRSELFSVDIDLVKQLMSSLEGKVVYPEAENKTEIFEQATEAMQSKNGIIPNGIYELKIKKAQAKMEVVEGKIIVKKGAVFGLQTKIGVKSWALKRNSLNIMNNILQEDFPCDSPSMAAAIVCGHNMNGWIAWKNANGELIDIYRQKETESANE